MSKRKNRRSGKNLRRHYEPRITPTHHVRLHRVKIQIDTNRKWYVVRTAPGRERKVKRGLDKAGFATFLPVNSVTSVRRGRAVEIQQRPAAGYLFVGVDKGSCGRQLLWNYHDEAVAATESVTFTSNTGEMATYEAHMRQDRPFFRVMGPFKPETLQRFADHLDPTPVAVLWQGDTPLITFPAHITGLVDGEAMGFAGVLETPNAA